MRSRPVTRRKGGILLGVLLPTGSLAPFGAQAGNVVPTEVEPVHESIPFSRASVPRATAMTPHRQVDL